MRSSCRDLRQVELSIHEEGKLELPGDGCHFGFLEDQLAPAPPAVLELARLADRGHIFAGVANGAQRAAVFGGEGLGKSLERYVGRNRGSD